MCGLLNGYTGITQVKGGVTQVKDGITQVKAGSTGLRAGSPGFKAGLPGLRAGITQVTRSTGLTVGQSCAGPPSESGRQRRSLRPGRCPSRCKGPPLLCACVSFHALLLAL